MTYNQVNRNRMKLNFANKSCNAIMQQRQMFHNIGTHCNKGSILILPHLVLKLSCDGRVLISDKIVQMHTTSIESYLKLTIYAILME